MTDRGTQTQAVKHDHRDQRLLSYGMILAILLIPRLFSAAYNIIHDTDETYNYWEPLHFLLHGQGFQTWEYSPVYAIRSWTYIAIHAAPLWLVKGFTTRSQQFYILRYLLGSISAVVDSYLVSTISQTLGNEIALLTLVGLVSATGMFVASTALLPSSFTMYTSTLGLAFALKKQYFKSTVVFAVGTILGWPFSALLFAPVVLFSIFERQVPIYSYLRGVVVSLQILLFSTIFDYTKYHIWTVVPLNIVVYNVFAARQGRGPAIFGTEPASYYIKNLLLNFNVFLPFAIVAIPASLLSKIDRGTRIQASMGFLIWFVLFSSQAHKEERFMYPAYPALLLSAAIGMASALEVVRPLTAHLGSIVNLHPGILESTFKIFTLVISTLFSILRITSIVNNYGAPMDLFPNLPAGKVYCIGSDWYRFPTSFLLPQNTSLSFVESSFQGLLPGKFVDTWTVPEGMNDLNKWSADKVVNPSSCDAMITWQEESSSTHQHYFLDRETGTKRPGYYGYDLTTFETGADRLNRLGIDLFGRKLDKEGKRFEEGELAGAIQRDSVKTRSK